jgi:hypothetical protein
MIELLLALADRLPAGPANVIPNISTIRFENITGAWGGWTDNQTGSPDWGLMLWNIVSVYPDAMGLVAFVILFSTPFIMMWLAHADMVPAAILGIFFGLYVFAFIPDNYSYIAIAMIMLAATVILLQVWQKRP